VRRLPKEHRDTHPSGLLVTTPPRTAVDVAADHPLPEALITLDSAARRILRERVGSRRVRDHNRNARLLESVRGEFIEAMAVAATLHTRAALRGIVPLVDPRRESALESLSYGEMVRVGFPLPQLQVPVTTPEGLAFPDFLWAEARVIGEADGKGKYTDRDALLREKRRQELLEEMGFRVIRWSWEQMRLRPAKVLHRIEAALAARMG
jgi:very-short-patch-repair endonuclease